MVTLPKKWYIKTVDELFDVQLGKMLNEKAKFGGDQQPYLTNFNVQWGRFKMDVLNTMCFSDKERKKFALKKGDLIVCEGGEVGRCAIWNEEIAPCYYQKALHRLRPKNDEIIPEFMMAYMLFISESKKISDLTSQSSIAHLTRERFLELEVLTPPLPEQRKIAEILYTWDEALEKLDTLIEAKERSKKALMQHLISGQKRLKGFDVSNDKRASDRFGNYPVDWRRVRLGDVTREVPTKNSKGVEMPVLSCTKHRGLVLSKEYFGKRVYAEDTSGYRVVQRGEFAYATNHIEEGSIGYQNRCDAGLVSPIYTVFKTSDDVDDGYFFRVLKSPLLIHFYQINTSASVDRRGSLRYDEFSRIHIWLPSKSEQIAIAKVFDTADQELSLLRNQRATLDQQKRGLMQRLLTGKVRVAV